MYNFNKDLKKLISRECDFENNFIREKDEDF